MPFPPRLLSVGEEVAVETRPHWTYLAAQGAVLVVLGAVAGVVVAVGFPLPAVVVVAALAGVAAVAFVIRLVRWANTYFVVTNHRIVYWKGLPLWRGTELRLELVEEVEGRQSSWGRFVGVGNLAIRSTVQGHVRSFGHVPRPGEVRRLVHAMLRAGDVAEIAVPPDFYVGGAPPAGRHGAMPGDGEAPPGYAEAPHTIPEQILQLYKLVEMGILSEAEFESKKRDLLGRL